MPRTSVAATVSRQAYDAMIVARDGVVAERRLPGPPPTVRFCQSEGPLRSYERRVEVVADGAEATPFGPRWGTGSKPPLANGWQRANRVDQHSPVRRARAQCWTCSRINTF